MRGSEFTMAHADLAPLFDAGAIGGELNNASCRTFGAPFIHRRIARQALTVVSISDVDAPVRANNDIIGLIELVGTAAGLAGGAETHEQFAVCAELVDLVALGTGRVTCEVCHPHVAVVGGVNPVWRHHDATAEVG